MESKALFLNLEGLRYVQTTGDDTDDAWHGEWATGMTCPTNES